MRIYTHLVQCVQELIISIKRNVTQTLDKLVAEAQESLFFHLRSEAYGSFEVKSIYPWKNPADPAQIIIISGAVYDIKDERGTMIGSVVYGDTVLMSSLKINKVLISRDVINMTSSIQPTCCWTVTPTPFDVTTHLGNDPPVIFSEMMDLILPGGEDSSCLPAKISIRGKEIFIHGRRLGFSHIKPDVVRHFKQNNPPNMELLEIVLSKQSNTDAKTALPIKLALLPNRDSCSNEQHGPSLWILMKVKSKARKVFFERIAPQWRSDGFLLKANYPPIKQVATAAQKAGMLDEDRQLALCDLRDPNALLHHSLSQLMTDQPSMDTWMKIYRLSLKHIEACWCLDAELHGSTSPEVVLAKCGVKLPENYDQNTDEPIALRKTIHSLIYHDEKLSKYDWLAEASVDGDTTEESVARTTTKKPFVLTVICGTVGSRKEAVGNSLVRVTQEQFDWIEIKPSTLKDLPTVLNASMKERSKRMTLGKGETTHLRGLVICPENSGARELIDALSHSKLDQAQMDEIRIGCVATCVDVRTAFLDNGRMPFPGLLEMLADGWANYLIYTGPAKSQQVAATKLGVPVEDIVHFLHAANPRLSPLYAPDGHVDHNSLIEALTDETAFDYPAMQKARLLSYTRLTQIVNEPRMHSVTVRFSRSVDRSRFMNGLKSLFTELKPWPFYGNVYSIHGQLGFVGEPGKIFDVFHITLSGISRISQYHGEGPTDCAGKPFWLTGVLAAPAGEDKHFDEKLNAQFADWLRRTGPQQEPPRVPLKRSDLTDADLEKIHDKYHLHPLPPGWYYTGDYYVNMSGEKSFKHPSFDEFVAEYLQGENTKIAARNARLASHPVPDLFSDC